MVLKTLDNIPQIKRFKNRIKSKIGHIAYLKTDYKCTKKWYGNEYGGFYVNPTVLNGESIVYSFGIGEDTSFDLDIINYHKSYLYAFDPTPKSIAWVKNQIFPNNFHFEEIGIGKSSGQATLNLPKDKENISGSLYSHQFVDCSNTVQIQLETLQSITNRLQHSYIDVLKMDIEGAEYDIMDNILNTGIGIKQILLEIHERFFEDGKQKTEMLLQKLRNNGYKLFAISDSYQELSFIKI